jgi:hypothetical protein
MARPVCASQTRAVPSILAVAKQAPSDRVPRPDQIPVITAGCHASGHLHRRYSPLAVASDHRLKAAANDSPVRRAMAFHQCCTLAAYPHSAWLNRLIRMKPRPDQIRIMRVTARPMVTPTWRCSPRHAR